MFANVRVFAKNVRLFGCPALAAEGDARARPPFPLQKFPPPISPVPRSIDAERPKGAACRIAVSGVVAIEGNACG
jgi:hypothetical protein